jgi:hypothetical protein
MGQIVLFFALVSTSPSHRDRVGSVEGHTESIESVFRGVLVVSAREAEVARVVLDDEWHPSNHRTVPKSGPLALPTRSAATPRKACFAVRSYISRKQRRHWFAGDLGRCQFDPGSSAIRYRHFLAYSFRLAMVPIVYQMDDRHCKQVQWTTWGFEPQSHALQARRLTVGRWAQ